MAGAGAATGDVPAQELTGLGDAAMDWVAWHEGYEASPALIGRLRAVRAHISRCLDASPPGPVSILSVCAGDGQDLIGALIGHPRAADVRARLIELDPRLAERGRDAAEGAGLAERIEFAVGDATRASAYRGLAPAQIVLVCGVFGNIRSEDTVSLIEGLGFLCARGGFVLWTRGLRRGGAAHAARIRSLLIESGFEEASVEPTADGSFLVGTSRHLGESPFPSGDARLFTFADRPRWSA